MSADILTATMMMMIMMIKMTTTNVLWNIPPYSLAVTDRRVTDDKRHALKCP